MYLRVCFIAGFGTALHFFYLPRFKIATDSFSADKKIATRIASTSLCSMFTKVNIPFVCVPCSPLHSFGIYLRKYFVLRFGLQTQWKLCRKQIDSNELWWVRFTYKRNIFLWKISHECVITFLTELTVIYSANSPQTCKGLKKLWSKVAFCSRLCRQVVFIPGISRNSWLKKEIMSIIQKSK